MAGRIRTVKPDFWTDSKVVQLSPYARLLAIGIWNFADDSGCIEDDPMQLKLQILPADPVDVESLVDELLKFEMVQRATAEDGVRVLVVRRWEHQKISRPSQPRHGGREGLQYLPRESSLIAHGALTESSVSPQTCRSEAIHGALTEPSMLKGREGKGRDELHVAAVADDGPDFDDFWNAYPRHHKTGKIGGGGAKAPALKNWKKLKPVEREACMVAVQHYAKAMAATGEYVKHPEGWLSERRWEDWQEPADNILSSRDRVTLLDGQEFAL